jgi:hypothetical protein
MSKNNSCTFEDDTITSSQNVERQVPSDAISHSRTGTSGSTEFLIGSKNSIILFIHIAVYFAIKVEEGYSYVLASICICRT